MTLYLLQCHNLIYGPSHRLPNYFAAEPHDLYQVSKHPILTSWCPRDLFPFQTSWLGTLANQICNKMASPFPETGTNLGRVRNRVFGLNVSLGSRGATCIKNPKKMDGQEIAVGGSCFKLRFDSRISYFWHGVWALICVRGGKRGFAGFVCLQEKRASCTLQDAESQIVQIRMKIGLLPFNTITKQPRQSHTDHLFHQTPAVLTFGPSSGQIPDSPIPRVVRSSTAPPPDSRPADPFRINNLRNLPHRDIRIPISHPK